MIESVDDAKALEGKEIGLSDWAVIDQHRIDQFAEATADHQWIHVDTERAAAELPDGKTIAHLLRLYKRKRAAAGADAECRLRAHAPGAKRYPRGAQGPGAWYGQKRGGRQ